MERVVINGMLYRVKNGTCDKIDEALKKGSKSSNADHENGVAYNDYKSMLTEIQESMPGTFIKGCYSSY